MKKREPILYIDDEKENLNSFRLLFGDIYKIFLANTVDEAYSILDENEIKVIISDQKMPEKTGLELCKDIKQTHPDIILMITTAYSNLNVAIEAVNQDGIYHFMLKPWNNNEVILTINKALDKYYLQYENKKLLNDLKYKNEELEAYTEELLATTNALEKNNKELTNAKEKAEESDQLKTEFIQNMSHEIRTPMNGIIGFSKFLKTPNLTKEKQELYIDIISNSSNQLLRIIDDILEISRLETKQVKIIERQTCLNKLLSDQFSIFDIIAKEKKLELSLKMSLSDEESNILTDETKLNKILGNLLENAFKYTKEGHIEFGYSLNPNSKPSTLEFYVKDTGIGIASAKQRTIFERFSQEEKDLSRKFGGLGLGLSIAKENAELIGGSITLQSEKRNLPAGKAGGSSFFVTIPYKQAFTKAEKKQVNAENRNTKEKRDEYTVLIVEDEEVNYLYLKTLLEDETKLNFKVQFAKNGQEAVEISKNNPKIDLILMDLKMPVMNGFEATKAIKKIRPNLPIIAQTAYSTKDDREKAISTGCDDFISKPIDKETFIEICNKNLALKKQD